jgi:hypothetical protein
MDTFRIGIGGELSWLGRPFGGFEEARAPRDDRRPAALAAAERSTPCR